MPGASSCPVAAGCCDIMFGRTQHVTAIAQMMPASENTPSCASPLEPDTQQRGIGDDRRARRDQQRAEQHAHGLSRRHMPGMAEQVHRIIVDDADQRGAEGDGDAVDPPERQPRDQRGRPARPTSSGITLMSISHNDRYARHDYAEHHDCRQHAEPLRLRSGSGSGPARHTRRRRTARAVPGPRKRRADASRNTAMACCCPAISKGAAPSRRSGMRARDRPTTAVAPPARRTAISRAPAAPPTADRCDQSRHRHAAQCRQVVEAVPSSRRMPASLQSMSVSKYRERHRPAGCCLAR